MKIVITKRFKKEYEKKYKKYFSFDDFINILNKKYHKLIDLHTPFFKFKHKINKVDFRGVVCIIEENEIIPLLLFLKKDKKSGKNVSWTSHQDIITEEYIIAIRDIENGDFEVF